MARQEALGVKAGEKFLNLYLVKLVPGRTLESIKGVRRRADYRSYVQAALLDVENLPASPLASPPAPLITDPLQVTPFPSVTSTPVATIPSTSPSFVEPRVRLVSPIALTSSASVSPEFARPSTSSRPPLPVLLGTPPSVTSPTSSDWQSIYSSFPDAIRHFSEIVANVRGWRSHELVSIAQGLLSGDDPEAVRLSVAEWFSAVFPLSSPNVSPRPVRQYRVSNPTRKQRRRWEYAAVQRLFRKNMSRCVRSILDGIPLSAPAQVPPFSEMVEFWSGVVTQPSKPVAAKRVVPVKARLKSLWGPVTADEVTGEFVPLGSSPGPDGVSPRVWRAVPTSIQALFFNILMFLRGFPASMLVSRTIFVPKKGGTGRPSDFRPISVSSVVVRHFHKILAARLQMAHLVDDRQRCFDDGCAENSAILSSILYESRRNLRPLHFMSADIMKAFDSVSHEAVIYSLRLLGVPEEFISYCENLYNNSCTQFLLHGQLSPLFSVSRGVRQGDPLSSLLFAYVIDLILKELPRDVFVDFLGLRLSAFAYADDVYLFGTTVPGLQLMITSFEKAAARYGLRLNLKKCFAFSLVPHGKRKTFKVLTERQFHLSSGSVLQLDSLSRWSYLGVEYVSTGSAHVSTQVLTLLERLSKAPLKPQQRLLALRSFLLPRIFHPLVLGRCNQRTLRELDLTIRSFIRRWLRLPKDVPIPFFYASTRDGGLGIPCLGFDVPARILSRFSNLCNSSFEIARVAAHSDWVNDRIAFAQRSLLVQNSWLFTKVERQKYWRQQLYGSVDGFELRQASDVAASTKWIRETCLSVPGRDYVQYVHVLINALPSAVRTSRGRRESRVFRCRAGCNVTETTAHVIQGCFRTHGGRIRRHDAVCKILATSLQRRGYSVAREHLFETTEGRRKPDLIAVQENVATVIDAQVVTGARDLNRTHVEKREYYRSNADLSAAVRTMFAVSTVLFTTATLSWRGIWAKASALDLTSMGLSTGVFRGITTRVLQGSSTNFNRWTQMTARAGARVRRQQRAVHLHHHHHSPSEANLRGPNIFPRTGVG